MNPRLFSLFYKKSVSFILLAIVFILGICIGNLGIIKFQSTMFGKDASKVDDNYFRYYNMFRETYKVLKEEFVDTSKLDSKTLLTGAIKGMLASTEDPYTDFLTPEIAKEFAANINATFYGVGIRIEMRNNWLTVVAPISGTPAAKADLQPGDQIIEIDKQSTEGLSSLEAVGRIRGKIGTTVELTILRPGTLQPFPVTLKRAKIDIDTVEKALIPYKNKNIAYIKLIEFGNPTAKEFSKSLTELMSKKPDGLILDVRNNPGGLLDSVAKITDTLIDEGLIVYTRGRMESENFEFRANPRNTKIDSKIPIVILANQGSASASEILVGALKDTGRATVVGKTTFGKGCVQKTRPLADGSIIKYTIAKYYTPAGYVIAKIGIKPDIESDMWYDNLTDMEKTSMIQLRIANDIPNFLQTNAKPTSEQIDKFYQKVNDEGYKISKNVIINLIRQRQSFTSPAVYDLELDNQLNKALDVVTSKKSSSNYTYYHQPKTMEELQEIEKKAQEELSKNTNTNSVLE